MDSGIETLAGQHCAYCNTPNLTLTQIENDIPYFGKVHIFSMTCSNCKFHKADVECLENHGPVKWTLEITAQEDLSARVVKSADAHVKIPYVGEIEPGVASQGYISNVEGVLRRIKMRVESLRDSAETPEERKKAKNMLKKIQKVMAGHEKIKLIIEDPTGNSAIVSPKAVKGKLKK